MVIKHTYTLTMSIRLQKVHVLSELINPSHREHFHYSTYILPPFPIVEAFPL